MELDWNTTVARIYREAVAQAGRHGVDRQDAYDTAVGRIRRLIAKGDLQLPIDKAIRSELDKADGRDGRSADTVIKRIASGDGSLFTEGGDPILDLVVTLGKGRRKAWRDVTATDIAEMTELRQANARSAVQGYTNWRDTAQIILPVVSAHGSIGAAIEAGAFTLIQEAA